MIPKLLKHLELRHQEFERLVMKCMYLHGLWRGKLPGANNNFTPGRCYNIYLIFWYCLMIFGGLMYLIKYSEGDVYTVAPPCTDMFLAIVTMIFIALTETKTFEEQMERYYTVIHLSNYKYHNKVTKQVLYTAEERSFKLFRMSNLLLILGPVSYVMIPVLINYVNGAFTDHSIPLETIQFIALPFEYRHDLVNWIFASIIFIVNSVTLSYIIIYFIMFMVFIIIHLVGQMEIMKYNLQNLSNNMKSSKVLFTEEEDNEIFERIKRIVDHHNSIFESLDILTRCYGVSIFANYAYDAVAICLLLLVLLQNPMNFIRYGGLAVAVALQLGGQSFAMEQMNTSVDELNDAIYAVPWYAMSKRNMKSINIMTTVSQRPFVFSAIGIVDVNLQAMAKIVKSSFSYFLWLYAMGQQK